MAIIKVIEKNNVKYRCLDFLQSTGTQYINLGNFSWNADTDVLETKFKFDTISTTSTALWLYSLQGTSMSFDFYSQNSVFNLRPYQVAQTVYQMEQDTNVHNLKLDSANGKIYLDNVEKFSGIQKSSIGNVQFNLFRRNTGTGYASARIYNFFITRNGEKILDLIPVERISDNAIGLLDLISGTLYTNAGSGTFGKSYQQVEHIYKPKLKAKTYEILEYIESTGTQYINTGITYAPSKCKFEFEYKFNENSENGGNIFGTTTTDGLFLMHRPEANGSSFRLKIQFGEPPTTFYHTYDLNKHKAIFDLPAKTYTLDGTLIKSDVGSATRTLNKPIYLLATNGTSISRQARANLYSFKVYYDNSLVRDFIPVKRLSDNAYGMLDTLTNTFYANSGTGTFVGQSLSTPEYIEEDVEQVDYIENLSTAYIDTGIIPNNNTWIEMVENQSGGIYMAGVFKAWNNTMYGWYNTGTASANRVLYANTSVQALLTLNKKEKVSVKANKVYIDDVLKHTFTSVTFTSPSSLFLFNFNGNGTPGTEYGYGKIYSCKLWQNNGATLVRDLIPVKYGTEYCMLDLVEMKLYHNAGTGAFSGGNRVEVSKITQCLISNNVKYYPLDYIQSSGTQYIDTGIIGEFSGEIDYQFVNETGGTSKFHALFGSQLVNDPYNYTTVRLSTNSSPHSLEFATLITNQQVHKFNFDTNRHKIEFITSTTKEYLKQDNNVLVDSSLTGRSYNGLSMTLFGMNEGGRGIVHTSSSRIFSAKIKQNNSLVLDLIPVERATDNAKGMLDLVSGTFYGNSGSGTFSGNKREIILVE